MWQKILTLSTLFLAAACSNQTLVNGPPDVRDSANASDEIAETADINLDSPRDSVQLKVDAATADAVAEVAIADIAAVDV